MKKLSSIILLLLFAMNVPAQSTTTVGHFDKVIISPHIQVTFVEGNEEAVTIEKSSVRDDKIKIEVKQGTLRLYLDGAKEITRNEKVDDNGNKVKRPRYEGTVVTAIITYKTLDNLSIRGEQKIVCKSPLKGDLFKLRVYGASDVVFSEVHLGVLKAALYGESILEIHSGEIKDQQYQTYGESRVNSLGTKGNTSRIVTYGPSYFSLNVVQAIRITSYGDANLKYRGSPAITRGLLIGDVHIDQID